MSKINTIVTDGTLTFSTTPIVQTISTDNSTKLASTAYVKNTITSTVLTTNTTQTLSNQTITPAISATTIDATGTIQLGQATDTTIIIGPTGTTSSISLAGNIQGITSNFPYFSTGCSNTTTSFGTAVQVQKLHAGRVSMTTTAQNVIFPYPFTSTPVVVIGQTNATTFTPSNRWVTNTGITGFTANVGTAGQNIDWIAVGT